MESEYLCFDNISTGQFSCYKVVSPTKPLNATPRAQTDEELYCRKHHRQSNCLQPEPQILFSKFKFLLLQ